MAQVDYTTSKKVTKPIELIAVTNLLAIKTDDVAILCKCNKINKWSKHKPVRCEGLFPDVTHFKNYDTNAQSPTFYGLRITGITSYATFVDDHTAKDMYEDPTEVVNQYAYEKPQGTADSPYRLGDFDGYYHAAKQFCTPQNITKAEYDDANKYDVYKISTDTQETEAIRFVVDGIRNSGNGGLEFSDFQTLETGRLVLCANVFSYPGGAYLGEYINNSIRLGETTEATLEREYDDWNDTDTEPGHRYKYVDVKFDKQTYWGSATEFKVVVYLTLDYVKYDETFKQWYSERKIIVPFDDEHYYKKKLKFDQLTRVLQAMMYQTGTEQVSMVETIKWESYNTPISNNNLIFSPRVKFSISKTAEAINIVSVNGNGHWIRTKYYDPQTGAMIQREGWLFSESGGDKPSSITVGEDEQGSEEVEFYYEFQDIFGHTEDSYFVSGHYYTVDLYLVDNTSDQQTETRVGSMFIIKQ